MSTTPRRRHSGARASAPEALIDEAAAAHGRDPRRCDALLARLAGDLGAALDAAGDRTDGALSALWQCGWSPAEAVHVTARRLGEEHAALLAWRALAELGERAPAGGRVHPRWREQLEDLAVRAEGACRLTGADRLAGLVAVLALLRLLPAVVRAVPPPGAVGSDVRLGGSRIDVRVLARVRAMLAKAESTEFDQEAEALSAKAQQLIARHAIDEALLAAGGDVGEPAVRRLLLDDPYADAKAHLIGAVASANRCRVVRDPRFGWVTAFGFDADLDALELLATSLLAQASAAMLRQGSKRDAAGRSRTRSFRRAFLLGYAGRVGERLRSATDEQVAAAEPRLLPVLASREQRVHDAVAAAFPRLERRRTSLSHAGGWRAGRAAAEHAELNAAHRRLRDG